MSLRLPAKFRIKIAKVLWITIIWSIVGVLEALYIHVLAIDFPGLTRTGSYSFFQLLVINVFLTFTGGLVGGLVLVFGLRGRFRDRSFSMAVFLNTIVLVIILLVVMGIASGLYVDFFSGETTFLPGLLEFYSSYFFLSKLVFWLILIFLTTLTLDVNDKFGAGVLRQFILGKYHNPREEERIFMFLDMKGSTGIAEQIGHIRFFELLNDFFRDITDPILYSGGSIYQYIGDEIVIVWRLRSSRRNANCIRCFYNIREAISSRKDYYQSTYGLVPEFKAGIHCGMVTIGEVGVLKKDIVFSGDVLNTTSRIQSLCNEYGVSLLVSRRLLKKIALPPDSMEPRKIGNISLKGKKKKVALFTISEGWS